MKPLLFAACAAVVMNLAHAQSTVQPPRTWAACAACHTAGSAAIGPPLAGVFGRKAGSAPGFGYSRAMKSADITWDDKSLAAFVTDPQQAVPGNRMPFAGVPDAGEVAELVKYLKTLR